MPRVGKVSGRETLRLFQRGAGEPGGQAFLRDVQMLQSRDLDLSVKAGALLAFDALILTAGFNPIAASPGAPVSLDAVRDAGPVAATLLGVILLTVAAYLSVRAILVGEDVAGEDDDDLDAVRRHVLAAMCLSLDRQARFIAQSGAWTVAGGLVMLGALLWSVAVKF